MAEKEITKQINMSVTFKGNTNLYEIGNKFSDWCKAQETEDIQVSNNRWDFNQDYVVKKK